MVEFDSGHDWHPDIGKYHVIIGFVKQMESFDTISRGIHAETLADKRAAQEIPDYLRVINNEQSFFFLNRTTHLN
jgi:hypothetical protein